MTSNITPITAGKGATADGADGKVPREHGLAVLREREGRGLISLACDALHETINLAHEIHAGLYADDPADDWDLHQLLGEARVCLEAADHYLLMLGDVVEERIPPPDPDGPWQVEPAF